MKFYLSSILLFATLTVSAQRVVPFLDFNHYFKTFSNGYFRQIEIQPIKEFKYGDNLVVYVDMRENLRVYDGTKGMNVANINAEYAVSDNLMTWKIGETLNMWDAGHLQTLTYYGNRYEVKDSIIVFEDTRFNSINVYYQGKVKQLVSGFGELEWPTLIGQNICVFKDNGDFYKIFWRGQIYDVMSWNRDIVFSGETDIVCFNDPMNGTFTMFENGQLIDVEMYNVPNFKASAGSIMYTDLSGNLKIYQKGKVETVSNFQPDFYETTDSIMVWGENNTFYTYWEGKKTQIVRYIPEEYSMKNRTLVFKNLMGGLTCFNPDGTKELTNLQDAKYTIHGNGVLVELFNRSFLYYVNGKTYTQ